MALNHKSDDEYGLVTLEPNRTLPAGYKINTSPGDTDVSILKRILDEYITVDTVDDVIKFMNYKTDFAITILDAVSIIIDEKLKKVMKFNKEIEEEFEDINHRIIKPHLVGTTLPKEDKLEIFDETARILVERRHTKDAMTLLRVYKENVEKTRNFILGMNHRQYSPNASKNSGNPDYHIPSKVENMKIRTKDKVK